MERQIAFADLKAQYHKYKAEIDEAVIKVMESTQFIMGSEITKLEETLCAYTGAKKSFAVSSGTDALMLALMAHGVKAGDEVITSPFTFIATAEVMALLGIKPVFADIDEKTYNLDPAKTEKAITAKTRALMPVSLYGLAAEMEQFRQIAASKNLALIEDACQSFGAVDNGKKSCNLSVTSCTSFFPSKPLGCYGDGGAVFTNDENIAALVASLRNHGQGERYHHKYIGINGRFDTIQAAILNVKMKYFDDELKTRIAIGKAYTTKIKQADTAGNIITPFIPNGKTSVYAQYSIRVQNRDKVIAKLNAAGIPTAIHYPIPLHMQECFKNQGYKEGSFPISEKISKEIMSLPMSAFLKDDDQDYIVETLCKK